MGTLFIRCLLLEHALTRTVTPVIAENLIRAENTAVTPIDEIIKFDRVLG